MWGNRLDEQQIHKFSTLIFLSVAFFSLAELSNIFIDYLKNNQTIAEARELYIHEQIANQEDDDHLNMARVVRPQFNPLLEVNADVVGWLEIAQTSIHHPIVQTVDNEYYLSRDLQHENVSAGSIFMDYRNDLSLNPQHTILYGHRMKNGTMFGQLNHFLEESFFQKNRSFRYDTLYESYDAEIFAVYVTTTDFYYIQTDFVNDEEYVSFLQTIQSQSNFATDTVVTANDHILTLSTCDYTLDKDRGRLVIHAKLTEN